MPETINLELDFVCRTIINRKLECFLVLISKEDVEFYDNYKWFISTGYAARKRQTGNLHRNEFLHKIIYPSEVYTDHKNRIKLDNRRSNLRSATKCENNRNSKLCKNNKSGFKGVIASNRPKKPWVAQIKPNRKSLHLGSFHTKEEAARAYNDAAIKYFGEFACLNVIPEK